MAAGAWASSKEFGNKATGSDDVVDDWEDHVDESRPVPKQVTPSGSKTRGEEQKPMAAILQR